MKKNLVVGVLTLAIFGNLQAVAKLETRSELRSGMNPVTYSKETGLDWVRQCVCQYPELMWLADVDVTISENSANHIGNTFSDQLFGRNAIEFNRTLMSLRCLRLVYDGNIASYLAFTEDQPEHIKLDKESFDAFHQRVKAFVNSQRNGLSQEELLSALECGIILTDLGRSPIARRKFEPFGAKAPDHDHWYEQAVSILLKHPHICPSFAKLSFHAQTLIAKSANVAHWGHICHIEDGDIMYEKLYQSGVAHSDPFILEANLLFHDLNMAGAAGHVNGNSSIGYTKMYETSRIAFREAANTLANPKMTSFDAYETYLKIFALKLGLNTKDSTERVMVRLGAMLQLEGEEKGALLKQAMSQIEEEVRAEVIAQFSLQDAVMPTCVPDLLLSIADNEIYGSSQEERLEKAITLGAPFIAAVFKVHRENVKNKKNDSCIVLNFNYMAGMVKTSSEEVLTRRDFVIDSEGNVKLP